MLEDEDGDTLLLEREDAGRLMTLEPYSLDDLAGDSWRSALAPRRRPVSPARFLDDQTGLVALGEATRTAVHPCLSLSLRPTDHRAYLKRLDDNLMTPR